MRSRTKIIAVGNQKGGVGKTTTAVNLAAALAERGVQSLLVDFDPQANATSAIGGDPTATPHVYHAVTGLVPVEDAIRATSVSSVALLAAGPDLAGLEVELVEQEDRYACLKRTLEPLREQFNLIVIDCPPSLSLLTLNALCAADSLLIPVQAEYFALEGVARLMQTINAVRETLNPRLAVEGVLLTMTAHTNLSQQVDAELRGHFGDAVFDAVIPRAVRLSEAPSFGRPITLYDSASKGAESYRRLADEFLARNGGARS